MSALLSLLQYTCGDGCLERFNVSRALGLRLFAGLRQVRWIQGDPKWNEDLELAQFYKLLDSLRPLTPRVRFLVGAFKILNTGPLPKRADAVFHHPPGLDGSGPQALDDFYIETSSERTWREVTSEEAAISRQREAARDERWRIQDAQMEAERKGRE